MNNLGTLNIITFMLIDQSIQKCPNYTWGRAFFCIIGSVKYFQFQKTLMCIFSFIHSAFAQKMDYSLAGILVWLMEHAEMFPVHSDAHHSSQRGQSQCLLWLSALRHSSLALFHFLSQHEEASSILSLTNAASRKIKSTQSKKTNVVGDRYFQNIRKLKLEKCLYQYQTTMIYQLCTF